MSVDAMSYVKTLTRAKIYRPTRALLLVIAENTFNDTGECRVGQQVLCEEADLSERTLRRYLQRLQRDGVLVRKIRSRAGGGRLNDAISLVGFSEWLAANRPDRLKIKPAKLAGSDGSKPANTWPVQTGQQVAGSNKTPVLESRTSPPLPPKDGGRKCGIEFEVKGDKARDKPASGGPAELVLDSAAHVNAWRAVLPHDLHAAFDAASRRTATARFPRPGERLVLPVAFVIPTHPEACA